MASSDPSGSASTPVSFTMRPGGKDQLVGHATLTLKSPVAPDSRTALYDGLGDGLLITGSILGAAATSLAAEPKFGALAFVLALFAKGGFSYASKATQPTRNKAKEAEEQRATTLANIGNILLMLFALLGGILYLASSSDLKWLIVSLVVGLAAKAVLGIVAYWQEIVGKAAASPPLEDPLLLVFAGACLVLFLVEPGIPALGSFAVLAPSLVKAVPSLTQGSGGGSQTGGTIELKITLEP